MSRRIRDRSRREAPKALAVASHPIQYQAPWFRALANNDCIDFSVLFVQMPSAKEQGNGFGIPFEWDIPLLDGYRWQTIPQLNGRKGLQGFFAARISRPLALLRKLDPDALIVTGWHAWPLVQLLLVASMAGIPVIMRGDSNGFRRRPFLVRILHRLLLARCSAFMPVGRASRAFYLGYGLPESKLFDAPHFVDNKRFESAAALLQSQRQGLRATWAIANDATCFCYAGKLEPKKRILDLLEGLRLAIASSRYPMHLLIVGSGELMGAAKSTVDQHHLPVTFAGFLNQSEIPSAYVATDCLVLPSDYGETWGLVVNEAMACSRPAIVSDRVGCGPDLVTPGKTGMIFRFGDTAELARCLIEAAADPQALAQMGEAAHRRVHDHYSVEHNVQGTLAAVQYVIGR